MDLKRIADGDLWQARPKIIQWGEDIRGKPAGETEIIAIQNEISARGLVNQESSSAFSKGMEYLQAADYQRAGSCFRMAIKISPRYLDAYTNLGGCLIEMGKLDEARQVLEEGARIGLTLDLTNNMDRVDRLSGKTDAEEKEKLREIHERRMEQELHQAREVAQGMAADIAGAGDKGVFERLVKQGALSYADGEHERSIDSYTKALAISTSCQIDLHRDVDMQIHWDRGRAYRKTGRHKEAEEDFTRVMKLSPELGAVYYERGVCRRDIGEYLGAIMDLTKYLEFKPSDARAYHERGLAWAGRGDVGMAIGEFSKALQIDASCGPALANLKKVRDSHADPSMRRAASAALFKMCETRKE